MSTGGTQLVLFDLDGTLADTYPDLLAAVHNAFLEQGLPAPDPALVGAQISHGGRAMINAALTAPVPEVQFKLILDRFLQLYREQICVHTRLFPGMSEVLAQIEQLGMKWGVVTNKRSWLTEPLIDQLHLRQRLACLVSGDSAARAKPHPDTLLMALQQSTCCAGESLYVGDAHNDVRAARAVGMRAVVANYGYIDANENTQDWQADGYINTPLDLLDWLDK